MDSTEKLSEVFLTLEKVQEFMVTRDTMNAAMHVASVRYSPLTLEVIKALGLVYEVLNEGKDE